MIALPVEERLALLESEVARIKRRLERSPAASQPWWHEIAGTFADDPAFDEAMALGRKYREAQRPTSPGE
jgi:hypothetical protein